MDADAERTLNDLHVLAALSHNDKLMTNGDAFEIYVPTALRGLMRAWYGERRSLNIQRIRKTIKSAMYSIGTCLEEADALRGGADEDRRRLKIDRLAVQYRRMCDGMAAAASGLENLLLTYRDDATHSAQLQGAIHEVRDFLEVIAPHAQALHAARQCTLLPLASTPSEE